ncbi:molybdopterin-dependent oxidoreductase [Salidesulfovibrio brasiliensis]|uniref:molybdopterin-dependent oxidoreductase n=1 Tax=Salidesulfovibrio brasiliensis TaxID=221711 RepID=UPI000AB73943|nr:molybdopterin-dependent oxidoreductase [Salidesulfovibrio brasiliensis]
MGFDRRAFIQLITGGTVGILFTPVVWKLLDDVSIWTQNWPWIPTLKYGEKLDKPAVSKICNSGCAVNVRTVAGKPYATEGNADNLLSQGGICPMCANGVQLMRSPNRIKAPMLKGADGQYKAIPWDEAMDMLAGKIGAAGSKVAFISGDSTGTANEVYSAFLRGLGSEDFFKLPGSEQAASRAWNGLMGGTGQIGYDLPNADLALLVGADALESWGPRSGTRRHSPIRIAWVKPRPASTSSPVRPRPAPLPFATSGCPWPRKVRLPSCWALPTT